MSGLVGASMIVYFCLSILQFFALMDGFAYWLGTPGILNFVLAFFGAGIPLLGTIGGIVGATQVWGWELSQALLLFFGPLGVVIVLGLIANLFDNDS